MRKLHRKTWLPWLASKYLGSLLLLLLPALALPALALLGGCSSPPSAPLRIGANPWLGYEPLFLAKELGFFPGDSVQPVRFASASASLQALSERKLEAAALTLDEVLSVSQFDTDLTIVLVVDFSHGADALLARPEFTGRHDLKGQRIGVEVSAVGAYMLQRFLEKAQLREKEVQVVNLPLNAHEAAFAAGKIEAVITFEPVRSRLLARGAKVIFDSSDIPGEVIDVLVVRSTYLRENPKVVAQLLTGWFLALTQLSEQPAASVARLRQATGLTSAEILRGYQGLHLLGRTENRKLFLGAPPPLRAIAERLQGTMLNSKLLYKKSSLDQLLDQTELTRLYQP